MKIESLEQHVQSAAAIRYRARLQPAGGPGDKVFPPTYEGGRYAEERRRIDGQLIDCVHLDSVQSQANRMEEALLEAVREERITLPLVEVDFPAKAEVLQAGLEPDSEEWRALEDLKSVGVITSLDAPHRLAYAIIRDSYLNAVRYPQTPEAQRWIGSGQADATGLFSEGPNALVFGIWFNPTGGAGNKGNMGTKFQRVIVSELVGINCSKGSKCALRIDPVSIESNAGPLYWVDEETGEWTLDAKGPDGQARAKVGGKGRPSEVVHGNIPTALNTETGGVTVDYALQTTVLSLAALRKLHFPVAGKAHTDAAARTVLAALGLAAAVLSNARGASLRSRCDLVPEPDGASWEVVKADGTTESFTLTPDEACTLLNDAVAKAKKAGLPWREKPLTLLPSDGLAELVKRSRQLTSQKKGE